MKEEYRRIEGACRRRAGRLLDGFDDLIAQPFDIDEFIAACAQRRRASITIVDDLDLMGSACEERAGASVVTGVALAFADGAATIAAAQGLMPVHRAHVLAHELAHVLFEHDGGAVAEQQLTDRQVEGLFGDLFSPDVVRSALGGPAMMRCGLSTRAEREAEAFADELMVRAHRPSGSADRGMLRYGFMRPAALGQVSYRARPETGW